MRLVHRGVLAGQPGQAADGVRVLLHVDAADPGPPGAGGEQGGQDPHQGGLACPVRAEQALHGPRRDAHVHAGQRPGLTEGLADALHVDHRGRDPANWWSLSW